jgi:hypothetical protein
MRFTPSRSPAASGRPARSTGPVLSVGRRVFVNCPTSPGRRVTLTDAAGKAATESLADGAEVEILAWRPRGAGGTRYHVQSTRGELHGWLAADNLRAARQAEAPPAAPAPPRQEPAEKPEPAGRKFGQRAR